MPTVVQQAVIDKQCTVLRLSNNKIQSQGAAVLAAALYNNSTLERLNVFGNHVTDRGARSFAQVLAVNNFTLKTLSLGHNGITDEGAGYLAEMLKANGTLIELYLAYNRITDCGVKRLADVLIHHNRTLKRLSLDLNKRVSDASIDALVDAINRNQSLSAVGVSGCNLCPEQENQDFERRRNQRMTSSCIRHLNSLTLKHFDLPQVRKLVGCEMILSCPCLMINY